MSGSRQISPTGSAGFAAASFWPGGLGAAVTAPVVFCVADVAPGAAAVLGACAAVVFGVLLAMLLAGLEGIGPATRVQVSPPQRKPNTQPWISSCSGPAGLIVEL